MAKLFGPLAASLLAACAGAPTPGSTPTALPLAALQATLDSARLEEHGIDSLVIAQIDLGRPGLDTTFFAAKVTNLSSKTARVGLDLRTIPGLWLTAARQSQWVLEVGPRQSLAVRKPYYFRRMSPEAVLRVRFGGIQRDPDSSLVVTPVLLERRYAIGRGNPSASDPRAAFEHFETPRFDIYAYRGSLAHARIKEIIGKRDRGLRQIEALLGVRLGEKLLLVFYPDSARKTRDTGHIGNGFASGRTIVEIYNDSVQLDPYHELAHLVAGELGDPPALFDEGFATYVSERLGAPALRYLGHGDAGIREAVCGIAARNELIPLAELLRFSEIGSAASRSAISYPEAASIVAYLIETKGLERFREAYRTLRRTDNPEELKRNEAAFVRILGSSSLQESEVAWRARLGC